MIHRIFKRFAVRHRHVWSEELREQFTGLADRVGGADVAEVRRSFVEIIRLRLPAENPAD